MFSITKIRTNNFAISFLPAINHFKNSCDFFILFMFFSVKSLTMLCCSHQWCYTIFIYVIQVYLIQILNQNFDYFSIAWKKEKINFKFSFVLIYFLGDLILIVFKPCSTARCNGVAESSSSKFTSAPDLISNLTMSSFP